ncbi:hypothetical protein SD70_30355 [Gordoniibacillus kamchatkensis]|uniref:Uncharacterized protein n=1 Tax=Gordoniibacillus kamchatkensis TaxID=1590651 RepID=A0ABR5AAC2_9BACL|nr:hypothetical protein SD70_30355 [Paenibacillus sp. VKM B-2647]
MVVRVQKRPLAKCCSSNCSGNCLLNALCSCLNSNWSAVRGLLLAKTPLQVLFVQLQRQLQPQNAKRLPPKQQTSLLRGQP